MWTTARGTKQHRWHTNAIALERDMLRIVISVHCWCPPPPKHKVFVCFIDRHVLEIGSEFVLISSLCWMIESAGRLGEPIYSPTKAKQCISL